MAQMWVIKPGEEARLQGLEAEGARLQKELAHIESLSDEASCRICGTRTELTEEHAPSKTAGNQGRMIRGLIDYAASAAGGTVLWKGEVVQGATFESLCNRCNTRTGSWYNPAYVRFARHCRQVARPENAGQTCQLQVSHRRRVVKQALASLVATSQPGLTTRYPDLGALLIGKEDRRSIAPIQLWLYLRANPGGMFTGLAIKTSLERRKGHLVAGFSFWPLGWIMTIGDVPVEGAASVSAWTELDNDAGTPVTVGVPCQWAITPYPGDFRGPEEFPA